MRIFLTQAVATGGFPFEIKVVRENPYMGMSEDDMLARLDNSRKQASIDNVKDDVDVLSDMEVKL